MALLFIHLASGFITNDFLCICHAMYEYIGSGKTRNQNLEMADHTINIYDGVGIYNELNRLPDIQIINFSAAPIYLLK